MRPCPFCRCLNLTVCYDLVEYYVSCDGCGSTGPHAKLVQDAKDMWDGIKEPETVYRPIIYMG